MSKILTLFGVIGLGLVLTGCITRNDTNTTTQSEPTDQVTTNDTAQANDPAIISNEPMTTEYQKYQGTTELKIENLQAGNSANTARTKNGDTVSVHYTGYFTNGEKFDSSRDAGTPFSFILGANRVIKGWDQGFVDKGVGDKFTLIVPPTLGYGAEDYGPIPGNSVLVFEVEIMDIQSS